MIRFPAGDKKDHTHQTAQKTRRVSSRSSFAALTADNFDAWKAVGGVRGLTESIVPGLIFLLFYLLTSSLALSVIAPVVVSVVAIVVRFVQKIDIMPAMGGLFAVVISAVWAWRTGEVSDYFVWGFITNTVYLLIIIISMLIKWPLIGLIIAFLRGDATGWRKREGVEAQATRSGYWKITWLWLAMFACRLAVQLPMYYFDRTTILAILRIVMGPFLFVVVAWMSWIIVRRLPPVPEMHGSQEKEK